MVIDRSLDRVLHYRACFNSGQGVLELVKFAETVEKVCVDLVEAGKMTKDLAILISDSTRS